MVAYHQGKLTTQATSVMPVTHGNHRFHPTCPISRGLYLQNQPSLVPSLDRFLSGSQAASKLF
jgi:hypothetical protein